MAQDTLPRAAEFVTDDQLLADWFSKADTVTLLCWAEGHYWDVTAKDTTYLFTQSQYWGAQERCHRRVDGVSCKVRRTHYQNGATGLLDGPAAAYDYRAYSPGRPYSLPRTSAGYSILNRYTRAAIRKEIRRRKNLGEDVTSS
jgi:hypothetical protein